MDPVVNKMLFLHLPMRHPNNFPEIEISPLVQTAALVGVGLLYQETSNRWVCSSVREKSVPKIVSPVEDGCRMISELLLEEITRKPGTASKSRGPQDFALHHVRAFSHK